MNERWMHKEIYLISGKDSVVDFWVVLCIVCRLGFPGILAETYSFLTPLFDYGSCGVELLIMLLASGDSIWDLRVLDFKKKYVPLYVMMAAMLVMTFLVTSDVKGELTTCIRLAVTVLFGLWLADHYDTGRLLELICNAQGLFVLLNLLLFFVLRKWGFYYDEEGRYLFHGLMNRKNSLGEELAYGLVLQTASFRIKRRAQETPKPFWWFTLGAQLFLLVSTKAVGALFTAMVPIAYLYLHDKMKGRLPRFHWSYIYIVVSVGFLLAAADHSAYLLAVSGIAGQGRDPFQSYHHVGGNHPLYAGKPHLYRLRDADVLGQQAGAEIPARPLRPRQLVPER